jgi:hypothetical protein
MIAMARAGKVGEAPWTPNLGRLCLAILLLSGFCLPAQGADRLDRLNNQEVNQVLRLKVGRAKVLRTPFALTRISVADPDIADLMLISEREIYINALAPQGNFGVNQLNSLAPVTDLVRTFTGAGSASTTAFTQGLGTALTAGFNPKPAVGLGPQATSGEMDKYDKSFKAEDEEVPGNEVAQPMNHTRHNTRGTGACILTS